VNQIADHPWPGCQVQVFGVTVTLMSSCIAAMVLAGVVLLALVLPLARRRQAVPHGAAGVLEVVVYFVRDMIARPALHEEAERYMPLLLTLFLFILTVNLVGILPLEAISELTPVVPRVGGVATAIPTVAGALALLALSTIVLTGLRYQARLFHKRTGVPWVLCAILSPGLWVAGLAPSLPGWTGRLMAVPLGLLELLGVLAKCMALMIRLFANMLSGHTLLAVLMMFILQALETEVVRVFFIGPFCVAASVVVEVMELLVAGLQAYIFTFLTAMFLGLYGEPAH
jgi:F-type H+-transporting ATPase subunit a